MSDSILILTHNWVNQMAVKIFKYNEEKDKIVLKVINSNFFISLLNLHFPRFF